MPPPQTIKAGPARISFKERAIKTVTLKIQVTVWILASKTWLFMLLIACEQRYFYLWLPKQGL